MTPLEKGAATVDELMEVGRLRRLTGVELNVAPLMERAEQQLKSAAELVHSDPLSAYILAYDATRRACTALLAAQGIRPTADRGHETVEKVVVAQFGGVFSRFNTLRRRRNELEYPTSPSDFAEAEEAEKALESARDICGNARRILDAGALTRF